jgi:hypothetical protein
MTNDFSGGLRGLRPPATFCQPFGLRRGESSILMPFLLSFDTRLKPDVNEMSQSGLLERRVALNANATDTRQDRFARAELMN